MKQAVKQNPFKGPRYYEEKDQDIFYGRDQESNELFQLVKNNFPALVTGDPGVGKTSLINAGLFPLLRTAGYLPVRVDFAETSNLPLSAIQTKMQEAIITQHIQVTSKTGTEPATPLQKGETLWEYFHRVKHEDKEGRPITPVIVFDAFDKIFSGKYSRMHRDALLKEILYLVENRTPEHLWGKNIPIKGEMPDVRLLLVLRDNNPEDMAILKKQVPSIERAHFELHPLNGIQARQILEKSGIFPDETIKDDILQQFYPRHMETGEAEKDIPPKKLRVEPVLFSLFCTHAADTKATSFGSQERDTALNLFYNRLLWEIPRGKQLAEYIETRCLTLSGTRTAVTPDKGFKLRDALDAAVDLFILRKVYYGGIEHVEIFHNLLLPVIKERRHRSQEDKIERQEKKAKHRKAILAAVLVSLVVVSLVILLYIFKQEDRIQNLEKQLESQLNRSSEIKKELDALINIAEETGKSPGTRAKQPGEEAAARELDESPLPLASTSSTPPIEKSPLPAPPGTGTADTETLDRDVIVSKLLEAANNEKNKNKAIRIVEAAYTLSLPQPPPQVWQQLTGIAYSAFGSPFYENLVKTKHTISSVTVSPDGRKLLSLFSHLNNVEVWDLRGHLLTDLNLHTNKVNSAIFSSNSQAILTASEDKTAKLWDIQGNILAEFKPHRAGVMRALFSPGERNVLTTPANFLVDNPRLWDMNGNLLAEIPVVGGNAQLPGKSKADTLLSLVDPAISARIDRQTFSNTVFSPDGRQLLTIPYILFQPALWDIQGNLLVEFPQPKDSIHFATFSTDGNTVLTSSSKKTAQLWNLEGEKIAQLHPLSTFIVNAIFSPDNSRILTIPYHPFEKAKLWDRGGNYLTSLENHPSKINSAVFSPDGTKILTTSEDRTAKLWDLEGTLLADMKQHTGPVVDAVFSPDGKYILTASVDTTAKLWDIQGNLLANLNRHTLNVSQALFLNNGTRMLTVSADGTINSWFTPTAIIEWLKTAPIPRLTPAEKEKLGIADFILE